MGIEAKNQLLKELNEWLLKPNTKFIPYLQITGTNINAQTKSYYRKLTLTYKHKPLQIITGPKSLTLSGETMVYPITNLTEPNTLAREKVFLNIDVNMGILTITGSDRSVKLDLEYKNELYYAGNDGTFYFFDRKKGIQFATWIAQKGL